MEDDTLLDQTSSLLRQHWGLTLASHLTWEELHAMLGAHLAYMLAQDFAHLVNVMYRLDVPEARFNTALHAPTLELRASLLADAVLARERLRAEMRLRYANPGASTRSTPTDQ
jgi:hypothetical protein